MTGNITNENIAEMRECFSRFDKNGNGTIDVCDLSSLMEVLGGQPTPTEVKVILNLLGIDEKSSLHFPEFCIMWTKYYGDGGSVKDKNDEMSIEEMKALFEVFDENKDEFISLKELQDGLKGLGYFPNSLKTNSILNEMDGDGDGKINFQEFQTFMGLKSERKPEEKRLTDAELRAVFRVFDDDCSGDISREELRDVSVKRRGKITNDDLEQIINEANVDGNDTVNYEEFKKHYQESFNK